MLRVFGLLAVVAAACELFLLASTGPQHRGITIATTLSQEIGRGLAIFLFGAVFAGAVAIATYKKKHAYPGLATGTSVAVLVTAMTFIAVAFRPV
jgi:hypothetical protein